MSIGTRLGLFVLIHAAIIGAVIMPHFIEHGSERIKAAHLLATLEGEIVNDKSAKPPPVGWHDEVQTPALIRVTR